MRNPPCWKRHSWIACWNASRDTAPRSLPSSVVLAVDKWSGAFLSDAERLLGFPLMKRSEMPPRRAWIRRRTTPRTQPSPGGTPRTRTPRKPSEFARIYHSRARVRWVKSLPCVACEAASWLFGDAPMPRSQNAHTETGGMGYKAGYETIVPLCASHHRRYDEHKAPFDTDEARQAIKDAAAATQAAWERYAA
jgi:hypothetical protein